MKSLTALLILLAATLSGEIAYGGNFGTSQQNQQTAYYATDLSSLGGTVSRGNSINNFGLVAGYSNLTGNQARHASLWLYGFRFDLGTLGGPNSSVVWPVKNNIGLISGIAQTAAPDPLGERWSCASFFPGPNNAGYICRGFVWERGAMRALPTLGGNNGFAAGANNHRQIAGWAENNVHDPACVPPQVLQFRPVIWGPGRNQIRQLPLVAGDTSGAATALNDRGQVVGISGICDQAVGRYTAKHAVLWENGGVTDIGDLGADVWNTPTAINGRGDIVGFAGQANDPEGNFIRAFIWMREGGIQPLGTLSGDVSSQANGINERRQVVGSSCDADGGCRAFLWEKGVMKELAALLALGYSNLLINAQDINDFGVITGRAFNPNTGELPAFVAIPVPGHRGNSGTAASPSAQTGSNLTPKIIIPGDVKQEILHPLSPGRAKLLR